MIIIRLHHRQVVKLINRTLVKHIAKLMAGPIKEHITLVQRIKLVKHMVYDLSKNSFKDCNILILILK